MDPRQGQPTGNQGQPPIVPNPHGMAAMAGSQQQMNAPTQAVASHLMELMANPALAAAAAASPLFPPAAMISNPGAFFSMPQEYFAVNLNQNVNNGSAARIAANSGSVAMPKVRGQNNGNNNNGNQYTGNSQVSLLAQGRQKHVQGNLASQGSTVSYGTMSVPSMPQSSNIHAQAAAAAAAAAATLEPPPAVVQQEDAGNKDEKGSGRRKKELSAAERAKQNRDRNREHARSTRLRKKVYVQKLKELVEGLHAERSEEVRQRRVAIQHLAEMQNVRRGVIRSFLRFHSTNERDPRKWSTLLEDSFWLKQPVTPYRCFPRKEIDEECRISRGVEGVIADAASVAVMIEGVGSRSVRWMQIKRDDFFMREEERTGIKRMPRNIVRQTRFQQAISSLSSSSCSSNNGSSGSSGEEANKKRKQRLDQSAGRQSNAGAAGGNPTAESKESSGGLAASQNVSNSSGSCNDARANIHASEHFHDYHARPLPDPKLPDNERSNISDDSPEESNNGSADGDKKRVSTDSSSGDDSAAAIKDPRPQKRRKNEDGTDAKMSDSSGSNHLPVNIAKKGGISHNVRPVGTAIGTNRASLRNSHARLSMAPAVALPPFAGIGKGRDGIKQGSSQGQSGVGDNVQGAASSKPPDSNQAGTTVDCPAVISGDVETSSSICSPNKPQILAVYHLNEDDMILMEDIMMCPFVFRTQDAVMCGALAECVMPGMLRGHFSTRNKLLSLEMVYDAMGFMQQLERASGSEATAQIIPGSLEMALSPTTSEARVITLAEPPFLIVNVNEVWTRMTKYTQMEVEGKELTSLLKAKNDSAGPENSGNNNLEDVASGLCTCLTALHYDKDGREFVCFTQSYPLTNTNDEITHILHVSKELPPPNSSLTEECSGKVMMPSTTLLY